MAFAIPDHPWVDVNDGAAVRIAMTVGVAGEQQGQLRQVTNEVLSEDREAREVLLSQRVGKVFANLSVGADVASAQPLMANHAISNRGVCLFGKGFVVTRDEAKTLGLGKIGRLEQHIRHYRNGRDLTQVSRDVMVIDLFGLSADAVREQYPAVYQWVLERVKPERDNNKREVRRRNWWLFGETNPKLRHQLSGLTRYIATVETTKHRLFTFLETEILPDNMLVNIAVDNPAILGVLSSRVHVAWALAAGGRLGIGNDPRYNKTRCFETYPCPALSPKHIANIGTLAERIDAHRKQQQATNAELTLTGMYNVMEKLRAEQELNDKEKAINQQGLVSTLLEDHDKLDRAVFEAYGWSDIGEILVGCPGATTPLPDKPADQAEAEEELLIRLVKLNKERAREEANGRVRWLRPEYQALDAKQIGADLATTTAASITGSPVAAATTGKLTWPKSLREQIEVVRSQLSVTPQTTDMLATVYKRKPTKSVAQVLSALEGLGHVQLREDIWYLT
ncbi:type IIL restriction-modification enzyme MmeI [Haliea sp.]|uniref:type IIL restriction-modification enzyme MmeI n=1 Tax=Haliea sp. TaxID=1932666 RepID=UPI00257A2073|nr:type IIL restriction-modification enzyme MmeI [Haliea sp.]